MQFLRLFGIALIVFLMLDAVWLGLVARPFYRNQIGSLLSEHPNWWAAVAFYLLFVAGMVVFAIEPSVRADSVVRAVSLGGFFGLVTYGTYDLTNQAVMSKWPLLMTIVDMAWGTALAAVVCTATVVIHRFVTEGPSG